MTQDFKLTHIQPIAENDYSEVFVDFKYKGRRYMGYVNDYEYQED